MSEVCRLSIHKHRAGEGVEGGMEKALRRGEKGEREEDGRVATKEGRLHFGF